MKKIFGITALSCVIAAGSASSAYAAVSYDVDYDYANTSVTVNFTTDTMNDIVAFQILGDGKSFDNTAPGDAIYYNQLTAEKAGKYQFTAEYRCTSGEYKAKLVSKSGTSEEFTLLLVRQEDMKAAYDELNAAAAADDSDAFANVINNKRSILNFGFAPTDDTVLSDELADYMEHVKANPLSVANADNSKIFCTYMTMQLINKNALDNIYGFENKLYIPSDKMVSDYNSIVIGAEEAKYFTAAMSGMNLKTLDDWSAAYQKALVLTGVRYAKGYGEAKDVILTYGSVFGISTTASDSVYAALAGNAYTAANFKSEYDKAVAANSGGNLSGGGSGGGSSGGKGGTSFDMGISSVTPPTGLSENVFNDIYGVDWATEAILALTDRGIVNGIGNGRFAPDDNVTREQFAKILASAMGIDASLVTENVFSDAVNGEWYCSWINAARNAGVVNGIGYGKFGVGMNITREDMCVMIYNALKLRGNAGSPAELKFSDAGDISDYAHEAVAVLYGMGVVNGVSETAFEPKATATRAQAAKIVYAVLDKLK